jgi:hypothetical protein
MEINEELELRTLLTDLVDLTIWMTGSADFGPEGEAHAGWVKGKPALDRALAYLAEETGVTGVVRAGD